MTNEEILCKLRQDIRLRGLSPATDNIMSLYRNGYFKPTTIGDPLSGLRRFLSDSGHTKQFLLEVPVHIPRERKIIEVYDGQELSSIESLLLYNFKKFKQCSL